MKRRITLSIALGLAFCINAFAQETLRIGDTVEAKRGSEWVQGRVESIEGNRVKVRFGTGKYDFQIYETPTSALRAEGSAAREAGSGQLRDAFRSEAGRWGNL